MVRGATVDDQEVSGASRVNSEDASNTQTAPATDSITVGRTAIDLLNDAPVSRFHRRAVFISGMGFFTDAYDLFVIATVAALVKTQWNMSTTQTSWVTGAAILGAFVGALTFGRLADVLGRKTVYVVVGRPVRTVARRSTLHSWSRHWWRLSRLGGTHE
jgi:hypothetical protein